MLFKKKPGNCHYIGLRHYGMETSWNVFVLESLFFSLYYIQNQFFKNKSFSDDMEHFGAHTGSEINHGHEIMQILCRISHLQPSLPAASTALLLVVVG